MLHLLHNYFKCVRLLIFENTKIYFKMSLTKISCNETSGYISCNKDELDLGITLKGGQSFRWVECCDGESYRGVFNSAVWTLSQNNNKLYYIRHGTNKDFPCEEALSKYFQLDMSLQKNLKIWADSDSHFKTTYDKIGAVRILNQDVVENLFSFICSSNNNITRISGMVDKLCRLFGKYICSVDGQDYHDFPTIKELSNSKLESVLRKEGFGYRAGYIVKSAEKLLSLEDWLLRLKKENGATYEHARESLMTLSGVGPKVADCICLMSLGHLESIPVDTHIFQVACSNYTPHLCKQKTVTPKIHQEVSSHLRKLWGPLAGWAQAVVFCVKINSNTSKTSKKRPIPKSEKNCIKSKVSRQNSSELTNLNNEV